MSGLGSVMPQRQVTPWEFTCLRWVGQGHGASWCGPEPGTLGNGRVPRDLGTCPLTGSSSSTGLGCRPETDRANLSSVPHSEPGPQTPPSENRFWNVCTLCGPVRWKRCLWVLIKTPLYLAGSTSPVRIVQLSNKQGEDS